MTIEDCIKNLLPTYEKHGVNSQMIKDCIASGLNLGLSIEACYSGLRMQLAQTFGEREYFTLQDVMAITGETKAELSERIEQYRNELIAAGEDPDDYFKPIEPQEHIKLFFPNGL